jgi:inosine-uridine nucleoside N-ribohydrolase
MVPFRLRSIGVVLVALAPVARTGLAAPSPAAPPASKARIPVILDTDIGDDIDDTWALVTILKSPELDLKLVVTDYGNTEYRARIVARLLEIAGRTDVTIAVGPKQNDKEGGQAEWVRGYSLADYPGSVRKDGVAALVETVMASAQPMTLVSIGPCPNVRAALAREPRIADRLRLVGMYGSLRRGYGGKTGPEPEWNVKADTAAARAVLAAPWRDTLLTPLDTCGVVQLKGERYRRVVESKDPLLAALIENYRLWCPRQEWCASDAEHVTVKSSTLFDPVAVYLAIARDYVETEELGVRVTDDGSTVIDEGGRRLVWATGWRSLEAFEDWLVERLTAPTVRR